MSLKISFYILCFLTCVRNGYMSYVGNEKSFRQNIADLLQDKLDFSEDHLPFEKDELSDSTPKNHSVYDFIVIGAGTSGSTIASRLSKIRNFTVLLIESGGKEFSIMDVPGLAGAIHSSKDISYQYLTESSNKYCLGYPEHKCSLLRGKMMGGTSSVNSFTAARGNRRDYNLWADEVGDSSWSYRNMLKYFKKLEDFHANGIKFDRKYHNASGPVKISVSPYRPKLVESFIKAGIEIGYSEVDYNGPEQVGFSYTQSMVFKGERWSSNRAYLRPIKNRTNIIVTQHSHVHKILINEINKRAYGVRYTKKGQVYDVKARKEVILSAGAISSPQILMLSGIGPAKHLRQLNIRVIKDLPVGENMLDHIRYAVGMIFRVNDSSTIEEPNVLDPKDSSIRNYINNKSGYLSFGTTVEACSFVNVDDRNDLHPNVELLFTPGHLYLTNNSIKAQVGTYSISPALLRPRSRGKILLRSRNPFDYPKIHANYLENRNDIQVLIKGIRLAKKIGETNALKRHGSILQQNPSSNCDFHGKDSDDYWECELRTHLVSAHHTVGTCRMGRYNSSESVVDSKMKVSDAMIAMSMKFDEIDDNFFLS